MSGQKHPMTIHGKEKLDQELDNLIKVEREAIKKAIAEARAHGDLKENAEYHSAKEKQALIEGRVLELQAKLGKCQVVDTSKLQGPVIRFGAIVKIYNSEKDKSTTYQIVGEDESKESPEKISYSSPLAKALIGKEEGDTVIVRAPKGEIEYEVEAVEYK